MEKINIEDINFDLEYIGYLWYSNAPTPKKITKIKQENFSELPFIIEGNLYDEKEGISIAIKNIDGEYFITRAFVNNLSKDQVTHQEFVVSNKLEGIKKIKMLQYWEETEEDELLKGMKTLIPGWKAFIGFKKD